MKTILFLVLMSPLSAFASYHCTSLGSPARGMGIDTHDPSHIIIYVDHQFFTATETLSEPGPFSSTTYELKNGLNAVEGTLVLNKMPAMSMTRGSSSCGRGPCFPENEAPAPESTPAPPAPKEIVTATLTYSAYGETEFNCEETTP